MAWHTGNNFRKQTLIRSVRAAFVMSPVIFAVTLHACGKMTPPNQSPPST